MATADRGRMELGLMSTGAARRIARPCGDDVPAPLGNIPLFRDLAPELLAIVAAEATPDAGEAAAEAALPASAGRCVP